MYSIVGWVGEMIPFPSPKVNVIALLKFELVSYKVAVKLF